MSSREAVDLIAARGGPRTDSDTGAANLPAGVTPPLRSLVHNFTGRALLTTPDPREFAWDPYVPAGCVVAVVGAGGTSKTGLLARLGVASALGEPLFGSRTRQSTALYVTAEDRLDDMHRHLFEALRGRSDADAETVGRALPILAVNGFDVKLVRMVEHAAIVTQQAQEIAAVAKEIGARLVILDTASRLNGALEDNEGLSAMIQAGELIAREADAAVVIAHHTGKAQARNGDADQYGSRGGSAFSDNARSVIHLAVVTEASKAPVLDAVRLVEAGSLLALTHPKHNYSREAMPVYLSRESGSFAARLVQLPVVASTDPVAGAWAQIADWLSLQREVKFPSRATVDGLDHIGTRSLRRAALQYAIDRQLVSELPHPSPTRATKTYFAVAADLLSPHAYRSASDGS